MNDDPEITLMQWMSVDELTRYSDALETIERQEALYAELRKEIDPKRPLIECKEALECCCCLMAALGLKLQMERQAIDRIKANPKGWDKLKEMDLAGLEGLADAGVTPDNCGGFEHFWSLVDQNNRKICEALRQRGHPILAQAMEQLADEL
jgi:hypothetical protein